MRDNGDVWEYIVVYVDDIIVAMKDTQGFFNAIQGPNVGFTMKGVGKPTYHLGTDFSTMLMGPCASVHKHIRSGCVPPSNLCMGSSQRPSFPLLTMRTIPSLMTPHCVTRMILLSSSHGLVLVSG